MRLLPAAWLATVVLVACEPPAEPPVPLRVEGLEQDLGTEVLLDVPVSSAAALGDLRVLAAVDEGLVLLEPLDPEPQLLDLDPGLLVGAAELPDGSVLISGSEGLFVLQEGSLVVSPLAALVEPLGPVRLHADGEDLWLAAEEGLYLWREGELLSVLPASLPAGDARLARGPSPDGLAEGTWVASADSVYFLRDEGDGLVAEPVVLGSEVSGLAVDGYGVVWLAIDGALQRRKPDGSWDWLELPGAVEALASAGDQSGTWVRSADGLWSHALDSWTVGSEGLAAGSSLQAVDSVGRVLVAGEAGLERVSIGRPLVLVGLDDGDALELPTMLHLLPSGDLAPRSLLVEVDGVELPVIDGAVALDPLGLGDGPHALEATAHYRVGEPSSASLYFSVGDFVAPSWAESIRPIFIDSCTPCHASDGGARLLDNSDAWRTDIDGILWAVSEGVMPLSNGTNPNFDPLTADEVQQIRAWAAGNFQE